MEALQIDHTANSSTASSLDSKAALSACLCLENTNLPSMTFGLASALFFTVTTHHHLLRCRFTCLYFFCLPLQTERKLGVCRENIFEYPQLRNVLLNILEEGSILTKHFCVIDNYTKGIRAYLNEQIIFTVLL